MDGFRVRNAAPDKSRKLLVPVSLGISSVCLLHLLDQMQAGQLARMSRAGFELHVVHIEEASTAGENKNKARFEQLQERYPRHNYHWTKAMPELHTSPTDGEQLPVQTSKSLASLSSQADMHLVTRTSTIVDTGKRLACESILWGDTTTNLAAKILAETAKGRGFSLPWQTTDGPSPFGIDFVYPMREMLKKELEEYVRLVGDSLADFIDDDYSKDKSASVAVSTKNNTIDGLMREYFEGVEKSFPSIVANVVRTSAKLQPAQEGTQNCEVCSMPVGEGAFGLEGWAGDQQASVKAGGLPGKRCYGCTRSLLGSTGWE